MNEQTVVVGDIVAVADNGPWYDSSIIGHIGVVTNVTDEQYASTRVEIVGHAVDLVIYMNPNRLAVVWPR